MEEKLFMKQNFRTIKDSDLLSEIRDIKADGYRLVQICATNTAYETEVMYTFDKDHELLNVKLILPADRTLESVTGEFWGAFIYENEMNDLFGITFKHNQLDYEGNFFVTAEPTPWLQK